MNGLLEKFRALERTYARYVVVLFFLGYFLIGLRASGDYGVFWDENFCMQRGHTAYQTIVERKPYLSTYKYKQYGVLFETMLVALGESQHLSFKPRELLLMRHLIVFLFFYIGVIFFYLLCLRQFKDWKVALTGCVFLIICPRIFAHSFYNSKDIPFLTACIISFYTMKRYLDHKTIPAALCHALSGAVAMGIRLAGIFIVEFTVVFYILQMLLPRLKEPFEKAQLKRAWSSLGIYLASTIFLIFLFWPVLWWHPIVQLQEIVKLSKEVQSLKILYMGSYMNTENLPWHYLPVNILITVPCIYSICFFLGCLEMGCSLVLKPIGFINDRRDDLIYLLWFFLPLLTDMMTKIAFYDDWRHLYFIYPAFVMIALTGLVASFNYLRSKLQGRARIFAYTVLIVLIGWNVLSTVSFMIRNHPFENVYFNRLAGRDMKQIKSRFELDYWGLSYRQALEYIARTDHSPNIKICFANAQSILSLYILPIDQRKRFQVLLEPTQAKYFLGNYRRFKDGYGCQNEYYSIAVDGAKIVEVCQVNHT